MLLCLLILVSVAVPSTLSTSDLPIPTGIPYRARMLPYERTSVDDCELRYFRSVYPDQFISSGSPAFPAHCYADPDTNLPPDVIRIGDLNLFDADDDEFVQERKIVQMIRHPLHNASTVYYDLALLKLDKKVIQSEGVIPTCLWLDDSIPFSTLEVAGWGQTGFGKEKSNMLLKAELKLMTNTDCAKYNNKRTQRRLGSDLADHQLCAWDEVMDTCPGDSGGPLHYNLYYKHTKIPFLVGVTSFGKACAVSQPGVYVKVAKFKQWIIETLQEQGEQVTAFMFEPLACASRNSYTRATFDRKFDERMYVTSVQMLWPHQPPPDACAGILAEPDAVVTLAQCVTFNGTYPSRVKLFDSEVIDITEIIVHPNYTKQADRIYNNIAVLKLKTFSHFRPQCILYGFSDYNKYQLPGFTPVSHGNNHLEVIRNDDPALVKVMLYENQTCNLTSRGLQDDHFCFGNKEFLVPGACNLVLGGAIYNLVEQQPYGLHLFGRDCVFGEPSVGLRLGFYKPWLESIFLPKKSNGETSHTSDVLTFIDTDLFRGYRCSYSNGDVGICVPVTDCSSILYVEKMQRRVIFCRSTGVICCPSKLLTRHPSEIETEFNDCEARYQHLRKERGDKWKADKSLQYSHTASIGWHQETGLKFECLGYLISTRGVVTAASCLQKQPTDPTIVRLGEQGWNSEQANLSYGLIEVTAIHPLYDESSLEHDIAVIKLKEAITPHVHLFPACLWQNTTHLPVTQIILNNESGEFEDIHPLYKTDCEKRLNLSITKPEIVCMNVDYEPCTLTNRVYLEYSFLNCLKIHQDKVTTVVSNRHCYQAGNPIVWREEYETEEPTDYLVSLYSHGDCNAQISLRIVRRVAFYVEWFAKVLK
ncbi:uncharacterized protein LOC120903679 isoform X2 [Anopheles arabiensis]|uniref:uncharacterized protein LOC120903679 isoform X2 n=1 Tax=Anopheles arabiensis TaxID=7173 RepID=UPI001AADD529|nr:uncharacterized protein LOC120903679 isoform X2 [Anopheles arabiensis]